MALRKLSLFFVISLVGRQFILTEACRLKTLLSNYKNLNIYVTSYLTYAEAENCCVSNGKSALVGAGVNLMNYRDLLKGGSSTLPAFFLLDKLMIWEKKKTFQVSSGGGGGLLGGILGIGGDKGRVSYQTYCYVGAKYFQYKGYKDECHEKHAMLCFEKL
ncbi:UNVERIFIED_CONTAM: hypothetical protein RMT77_016004 [Armadillidium vulgare]